MSNEPRIIIYKKIVCLRICITLTRLLYDILQTLETLELNDLPRHRRSAMNELQSLSQIFQNKLFRIPDYQRGYAWLDQQLRDFWEDLINLQPDRYHYFV